MATETPKVETTPPSDYDAMASVFDGLLAPEPNADGTPPDSTTEVDAAAAAAKAATPPAETPPAETSPGETPPVAETPPADGTPPAETPPAETPPAEVDWKAKFEALEAERAAAPPAAAPAAPAAETPAPAAETPPPIYSTDETEFLAQYAENWPDVARGEALRRRAEYGQLVEHVFKEFNRVYAPLIERGALAADQVAETTALSVIQGAHNDYDDKMYDEVITWANGLSGTRKRIAHGIIESGDPGEVVELITEFKSATGRKPRVVADSGTPSAAAPAAPAAPAASNALSAAAKKAAKALGVVDSKRSASTTSPADTNDFDAAWDEAVGTK